MTECVAADVCSPDGDVCTSDTCPLVRAGGFCTADGESHDAAKRLVLTSLPGSLHHAMQCLLFALQSCVSLLQHAMALNKIYRCIVRYYKCGKHADMPQFLQSSWSVVMQMCAALVSLVALHALQPQQMGRQRCVLPWPLALPVP